MGIYKHVHACACMLHTCGHEHMCVHNTHTRTFEKDTKKEEHLGLGRSSIVEFLRKMWKEGPGFRS